MSVLQDRLNMLGRILTTFQMTANQGMPVVVLVENMRTIHRLSGELVDELAKVDPASSVHVDPFLGPAVEQLLAEYMQLPQVPDHLPDDLGDPAEEVRQQMLADADKPTCKVCGCQRLAHLPDGTCTRPDVTGTWTPTS
jgi:hypothetical protein